MNGSNVKEGEGGCPWNGRVSGRFAFGLWIVEGDAMRNVIEKGGVVSRGRGGDGKCKIEIVS